MTIDPVRMFDATKLILRRWKNSKIIRPTAGIDIDDIMIVNVKFGSKNN